MQDRCSERIDLPSTLPSLDGWRALSISLVLGAHCKVVPGFPDNFQQSFKWLFDGTLGVKIFFLLSGFLITYLLLREHRRRGKINIRHFYIRRAIRILPVYFTFLSVLLLLQILTPYEQGLVHWVANLTFTSNFTYAPWTSGHLWSLAVEEQFYVLWPLLFILLGVAQTPTRAAWVLVPAILVPPVIRVVDYMHLAPPQIAHLFGWSSFLANCDSIAIGCATAILLHTRTRSAVSLSRSHSRWLICLGCALFFVPYLLSRLYLLGIFTVPFGMTAQMLGISILLVQSVLHPSFHLFRPLNLPVVRWIGRLSYSIYIWQQLFCSGHATFGLSPTWWLSFPGWLVPSILTAALSYYLLERTVLRFRECYR